MKAQFFHPLRVREILVKHGPKRKAPGWLLRVIRPLHKWLGDFVVEQTELNIETTRIDLADKLSAIQEHMYECENQTGLRPKYLIVGRDTYYEMTNETMKAHPFLINVQHPHYQGSMIFGLTVVMVPWIEGMFCLPDLDRLIR